MKIYGYSDQGLPIEEIRPEQLAEITLVASPKELRRIAAFLSSAADTMDRMGATYSHEHLADKQPDFNDSPAFRGLQRGNSRVRLEHSFTPNPLCGSA